MNEELFLTIEELAESLNVSVATLNRWHHHGQGPKRVAADDGCHYPLADYLRWRETFDPTSVDYRHTPRTPAERRHWLSYALEDTLPAKEDWKEAVRQVTCVCGRCADPEQIMLGKVRGQSAIWATCPHCRIPLGEPWIER